MKFGRIIAMGAAAVVLGACKPSRSNTDESTAAPTVISVTASEFAFQAPDTIPAGNITFRLHNGGQQFHHMQIIRLDSGKTVADFAAAMRNPGPPPGWTHMVGGPNAVVPGDSSEAVVRLGAGDYVMLCLIPGPDGQPHVMKGMMKALHVGPATVASPSPTADAVITLSDYDFQFSTPLTAGRRVIEVLNAGPQPHELVIAQLSQGKTAQQLFEWADGGMHGPPPGRPIGGSVGLDRGARDHVIVTLTPGEYALMCFFPDAKDGRSHGAHGMVKQFTVS
jgi:uncharacterized cupredoxin-like copper-binding protein